MEVIHPFGSSVVIILCLWFGTCTKKSFWVDLRGGIFDDRKQAVRKANPRMPPLGRPLVGSKFSLNPAGVAGFFGGKEAIAAMATVHLYKGRRWLGWFNSPGSYTIAKRFGRMANSRFWDGLFPGPNDSPAVSFGLDGKQGPKYIAALSGTTMQTSHLGYLTMKKSTEMKAHDILGRKTRPVGVSYLAMKQVDYEAPIERLPLTDALYGLIPIFCSITTCVMCGLVYDWYCFSIILLGIVSSGWASLVIGKGRLAIMSVKNPAEGVPPGHGVLIGEDEVVVIKGNERDVNAITKGRFELETDTPKPGASGDEAKAPTENRYHAIGFCSLLLVIQFLVQLLLIPQGTLFGQIMFLVSLGVSWGYNSYLASLEKEKIQTDILFHTLGSPDMCRFRVHTRTTMTVFVCLLLFHGVEVPEEQAREARQKILHSCMPNDTVVWRLWTNKVLDQLLSIDAQSKSLPYLEEGQESESESEDESDTRALSEKDRKLLDNLLDDAASAFRGYFGICDKLPRDSSYRAVNGQS